MTMRHIGEDGPSYLATPGGEDWSAGASGELDIVLVGGDAYVDHPSFGHALLGRYLEASGYKVGIIDQPDWRSVDSFLALGRPRLFFGVSSGNLDSMVANYSATQRRRQRDFYSPGGVAGRRPDRALIVYCNRLREAFPGVPIVIGGLEASLRRFAHYDYWSNSVRRSILLDAKADLLIYGMGELQILEVAHRLAQGEDVRRLTDIRGTAFAIRRDRFGLSGSDSVITGEFGDIASDKRAYMRAFKAIYDEQDGIRGRRLIEGYGEWAVVQNPPARPLSTDEMDGLYELPFTRLIHPKYEAVGGVPALAEVQFSVTCHRGCFGACSFCSLIMHQGRIIQSRSTDSVVREVTQMTSHRDWKGIVSDVGGPTANFHKPACVEQLERGACKGRECLYPSPCEHLDRDHSSYIELLRRVREIPGVKRVFVRSGVRFDYALLDTTGKFLRELCEHHISGQLKVAPEHVSASVLAKMHKPQHAVYEKFVRRFAVLNRELRKDQYLVPYFISGHPGCKLEDMVELAEYIRDMGHLPEQVQEFIPTPMTAATCMYYTGLNPFSGEWVFTCKDPGERRAQRALLQYSLPENRQVVIDTLQKLGRTDLIGRGEKCLIKTEVCNLGRQNSRRRRRS